MTPPTEGVTFDVLGTLLRRWRTLLICGAVGATAGLVYGFVAPTWYEAELKVVPSEKKNESSAMSFAAKLPIALDAMSIDVQRIQAVLTSNSVADEVIDRFNLRERYGKDFREHAREVLWNHCTTSVDRRSSVVKLTCEDRNPKMARDIAAYFGDVGNKVFARISTSAAHEERKFLEAQVVKARTDVDEASRKLREFQEHHKVVDLPEQSKATIAAMASLQGELLSKQLELSYVSRFSGGQEASVVQLKQQIAIMETKLGQLQEAQQTRVAGAAPQPQKDGNGFFPSAMTVPGLRFELEQLLRQQKIQETVFFLMTQRYEMAKIDEARETSTFQILDHPSLPEYKSRPKRAKTTFLGLLGGLVLGAVLVLLPRLRRRHAIQTS
jgi:capsule polysaccharide export protein KpsE/RkpR